MGSFVKTTFFCLIVLFGDSSKRVRKTKKSMKLAQSKNQVRTGQVTLVKTAVILPRLLLFCPYSLWWLPQYTDPWDKGQNMLGEFFSLFICWNNPYLYLYLDNSLSCFYLVIWTRCCRYTKKVTFFNIYLLVVTARFYVCNIFVHFLRFISVVLVTVFPIPKKSDGFLMIGQNFV